MHCFVYGDKKSPKEKERSDRNFASWVSSFAQSAYTTNGVDPEKGNDAAFLDEVRQLADAYGLDVFVCTKNGSACVDSGNSMIVKAAKQWHKEYKAKHPDIIEEVSWDPYGNPYIQNSTVHIEELNIRDTGGQK